MSQKKKMESTTTSTPAAKKPTVPKQGTIGYMALEFMRDHPDGPVDKIQAKILTKFPQSKFDKSHWAWYKHQVSKGKYEYPPMAGNVKTKKVKTKKTKKEAEKKIIA